MKTSIKEELKGHILDAINDKVITDNNQVDWHYHLFNEDYYIIGYWNAEQWLKKHDVSSFEAIGICQKYELHNFGVVYKLYDNAEDTVNMLAYIYGEELLSDLNAYDLNIDELKEVVQ